LILRVFKVFLDSHTKSLFKIIGMEQLIRETRYPNLIKFCDKQPETAKKYIKHFNTQESTTENESGIL
jgi:endonuclease V-like protein UPF0215 family